MIKMSYDHFEELCRQIDELPNIVDNNEGLTESDLEDMFRDPERFLGMAMYFLSRDYSDDHLFSNDDAVPASELKLELNKLIRKIIEFTD